jgi:hypothetical protein
MYLARRALAACHGVNLREFLPDEAAIPPIKPEMGDGAARRRQ